MTNEQSVALDKFLTENAINLDDAKKEIIRLIDVRRQEKWAQKLEERETIKKRLWANASVRMENITIRSWLMEPMMTNASGVF